MSTQKITPGLAILRRKFTATGGDEDPLNLCPLTSKYMKSYKYCVKNFSDKNETVHVFKTKQEAIDYLDKRLEEYNKSL